MIEAERSNPTKTTTAKIICSCSIPTVRTSFLHETLRYFLEKLAGRKKKKDLVMEDVMKSKQKDSLLKKMLRSLTFSRDGHTKSSAMPIDVLPKSKSYNSAAACKASIKDDQKRKTKRQVTPDGCFAVYVGPEKQKFAIKTECVNHPLFKMLLEDAESEYGFSSEGPILLPCDVGLFYKILAEMDSAKEIHHGCGLAYGSCSPFNPTRRLGRNSDMAKGYGSYGVLTPNRLLNLNYC